MGLGFKWYSGTYQAGAPLSIQNGSERVKFHILLRASGSGQLLVSLGNTCPYTLPDMALSSWMLTVPFWSVSILPACLGLELPPLGFYQKTLACTPFGWALWTLLLNVGCPLMLFAVSAAGDLQFTVHISATKLDILLHTFTYSWLIIVIEGLILFLMLSYIICIQCYLSCMHGILCSQIH